MERDLLRLCGVPEYVRWYANKCRDSGISYSKYAGWLVFAAPAAVDGQQLAPGTRIFSTSELYVRKLDNIAELASESSIYLNCPIRPAHSGVKISAPYISLRHFSSRELDGISAEHYVLYYLAPDITNAVACDYRITYICDIPGHMVVSGAELYGPPEFDLRDGMEYESAPAGYGKYHLMALGILPEDEVRAFCKDGGSFKEKNAVSRCLRRPPNPNVWPYPKDAPKLSYSDMLFLLRNKNVAEICEAIRRPFMYYYPDLDWHSNQVFCELAESTAASINAMKVEGCPNCA